MTNNGIFPRHFLRAKSKAGGDNCSESFRNGCHSQCHRNFKVVDCTIQPAMVRRITKVANVHDPNQYTNHHNSLSKQITKFVQTFLKRCLGIFMLTNFCVDVSDSRLLSRKTHKRQTCSIHNCRTTKQHVCHVLFNSFLIFDFVRSFVNTFGFTCENSLIHLEYR